MMAAPQKEIHWYEKLPPEKSQDKSKKVPTAESEFQKKKKSDKEQQVKIHAERYGEDLSVWLNAIANKMHIENRQDIALQALRGVLHGLRDRLIPDEVFDLSAQLPTLIRGIYFEGYSIRNKPEKMSMKDLRNRLKRQIKNYDIFEIDIDIALCAVIRTLHENVSRGELRDIYDVMPKDIKKFWNGCIPDQQF